MDKQNSSRRTYDSYPDAETSKDHNRYCLRSGRSDSTIEPEGIRDRDTMAKLNGIPQKYEESVKRVEALAAKIGLIQPNPRKALAVLHLDTRVNSVNLPTLKVNINKRKRESFKFLKPVLNADLDKNPHFDDRIGIDKNKLLRPKKHSFHSFDRVITAEAKKHNEEFVPIPDFEWWDAELNEGKMKFTIYVEHPRPIEPRGERTPPPPQPLKLTKKERKKLRTQRRWSREKERQEMVRLGLLKPPEPKLKMSNLMRVVGCEATLDPTRLEMEIRRAKAEREQAHKDRNEARKITPAERREKKRRKRAKCVLV